jgi:superfamily II DNA or RNA helicase
MTAQTLGITPYPDQIEFTNKIISKLADGYMRVCAQLATGGGKTVVFSYLISRYIAKSPSAKICILVHRTELEAQTKRILREFGLNGVRVEMVETFNNQLKKHAESMRYDMLIVDECHIANHFKVITHFKELQPECLVLGFSATPIAASKKTPLKSFFQTIVVGTEINKLISMKRLCPAIHYSPTTEPIGKIGMSGGDYNLAAMGIEFSKPRLVEAIVDAYSKYAAGKKCLIFNTTIEHSNLVNEAFRNAGYTNTRSIDSKSVTDEIRSETFRWLRTTPGAILSNVGIATTGFDDPSIEAIIFNRKTKSLPLWLQCCGRGARVSPDPNIDKPYFLIIDLGDNIAGEGFGHWNERHDWEQYFFHPDTAREGVAPMKKCPECDARIYMSSTECRWCGHLMPRKTVYTDMVLSLSILPEKGIKRNSHDALMKAIEFAAEQVRKQRVTYNEKRELMFYAFQELYKRSSFEPRDHIISHLVSVYGK